MILNDCITFHIHKFHLCILYIIPWTGLLPSSHVWADSLFLFCCGPKDKEVTMMSSCLPMLNLFHRVEQLSFVSCVSSLNTKQDAVAVYRKHLTYCLFPNVFLCSCFATMQIVKSAIEVHLTWQTSCSVELQWTALLLSSIL